MRTLFLGAALLTTSAAAQHQLNDRGYWDRCYGHEDGQPSYVWTGAFSPPPRPAAVATVGGPAPVGGPTSVPSFGGGAEAGYALLAAAVVAVAVLPVIVYAVDDDPPPRVLRNFHCPSIAFDSWGGGEGGVGGLPNTAWMGVAAARVRAAVGYFGTDLQFDASPAGIGSFSIHGLIRPPPKAHLEGGLALGYKRAYLDGQMREGFEVGLPQLYTLWRNEGRQLQLELRPGVFITTRLTVDLSVDSAVLIPVLEFMSIRVGARAFSYDLQPKLGFSAGLSLHL